MTTEKNFSLKQKEDELEKILKTIKNDGTFFGIIIMFLATGAGFVAIAVVTRLGEANFYDLVLAGLLSTSAYGVYWLRKNFKKIKSLAIDNITCRTKGNLIVIYGNIIRPNEAT